MSISIHKIDSGFKFLLARASWGARGSIGQDSKYWSAFELRCLASKTTLIVSPLGIIMRGFKNVVP